MIKTESQEALFFPYCYLDEKISLEIPSIEVDGNDGLHYCDKENRTVAMTNIAWNTLKMSVNASVSIDDIHNVLPTDEKKTLPISMMLVITCKATRFRRGIELDYSQTDTKWHGIIDLARKEFKGKVELQIFLLRTKDRTSFSDGYASSAADRLISSGLWMIAIDESDQFPGKHLSIRWEDFRKSINDIRLNNPNLVYHLDLLENPPVLYLNEAIPDLKIILNNEARSGEIARMRNVIFDQIAHPVWMSLVFNAAYTCDNYEDLEDWGKAAINYVAYDVCEPDGLDSIPNQFIRDIKDRTTAAKTIDQLNVVLQKNLRISKGVEELIKTKPEGE